MQWFAGNVPTAIQISRKNHALLVVYITNDSEDGRLFDSFWDQIDSSILSCPVVGIKLKAGETAAQQFADIYPIPILPAAYLINQSGEPLEVITPLVGKEYDQFRAKLNKAVEQFLKNAPVAPTPAPTSAPAPVQQPTPSEVRAPEPAAPPIDPNLAEKVARAKELLKIKKQKEEEQRRVSEKNQKEELMKAQKTRQEMEDKALMEAAKQRKKEKLEAGKEKERILAQIKADREDAKKRFGAKAENAPAPAEVPKSENVGKAIPSDRCRLQVRLPDGSIFVEEFPSNDVLHSLIEIIRQKPSVTGPFSINQSYPRRVFTEADFTKTYLENQLTPSSTLIVVLTPVTSVTSSAIVASTSVFSLLFSPFLLIWNLFSGWFGGVASTGSAAAAAKNQPSRVPSGAGPQNPGAARARGMPRPAEVRRRGNVAGLENPNDDDPEEKASFNGNSTQFM